MNIFTKTIPLILCLVTLLNLCGCGESPDENGVEDIITNARTVKINGKMQDTVEAKMGAFEGEQGDYIEFIFSDEQTFNTVFINEKTATVRQYNIYAEVDGKYKLIHTGKHILNENISVEQTTATAIKIQILNTEIGNNAFTVIGISAYNIKEDTNVN